MSRVIDSFFEKTIAIMSRENSRVASWNSPQVVRGSSFDMGYQQGKMNAERIKRWLHYIYSDELIGGLKYATWAIRILSPILRPSLSLYWKRYLKQYMPETLERLEGLARGSNCSLGEILVEQLIEIVGTFPLHTSGCSSLWVSSRLFEQNEPVLAKNFDYLPFLRRFQIIRESYPSDGYACIELTESPLVGSHSGLNECGLVIIYHYAYARDKIQHGLPMSMFVQHLLHTCSSVKEALEKAKSIPWLASGILIFGDTKNDLAVLEFSHSHMAESQGNGEWLAIANHYLHPDMMQYSMLPEARFPRFLPKPWKGTRIRENSEMRLQDMESCLKKLDRVTLQDVQAILKDHGPTKKGSNNTPCRHSKISSTICSIIFFPASRRIHYCHGSPCSSTYNSYNLDIS